MSWHVHHADMRGALAAMADDSFDACVTDPPYELGFMGMRWDRTGIAFQPDTWAVVRRVLKPGAHLVAFGGTRTYHRMVCAIEDAGFEIRDSIHWMYGSGFPKSLNLGDGIGTALKPGHEPIVLARKPLAGTVAANFEAHGTGALNIDGCRIATDWNEPDRPESWKRSGQSDEPSGMFGLGGTGIECHPGGRWPPNVVFTHSAGCRRVGASEVKRSIIESKSEGSVNAFGDGLNGSRCAGDGFGDDTTYDCADDCPVRALEGQSVAGGVHGAGSARAGSSDPRPVKYSGVVPNAPPSNTGTMHRFGDTGTAARFFNCFEWSPEHDDPTHWPPFRYEAKASTGEREAGLDAFPVRSAAELTGSKDGQARLDSPRTGAGRGGGRRNIHPTVKPIELMRWLCRLVTPRGGVVLDPFTGSGSTGCAAVLERLSFVGVELVELHAAIARARIEYWEPRQQLLFGETGS